MVYHVDRNEAVSVPARLCIERYSGFRRDVCPPRRGSVQGRELSLRKEEYRRRMKTDPGCEESRTGYPPGPLGCA